MASKKAPESDALESNEKTVALGLRHVPIVLVVILAIIVLFAAAPLIILGIGVAWVWSRIGYRVTKKGLRGTRERMQTAVIELVNPRVGGTVTLYGAVHVGESRYYDEMQADIDRAASTDGAVVLYEKVEGIEEFVETERPSEEISAFIAGLRGITAVLLPRLRTIGFVHQLEGLAYRESWVRTDTDARTLFAALTESGALRGRKGAAEIEASFGSIGGPEVVEAMILNLSVISAFFGAFEGRAMQKVILDDRNEIAVRGILDRADGRDIVSIWGAAHLPGMLKLLRKAGWTEKRRRWLTYRPNPTFGLKDVFSGLLSVEVDQGREPTDGS